MAKLNSSTVVITVSELLRDDQPTGPILDAAVLEQLNEILQELVGPARLIEIIESR